VIRLSHENTANTVELRVFYLILPRKTSKLAVIQVYRTESFLVVLALEKKTSRLYFIDVMRAWAILMMLQGHFVDGLLDNVYRDNTDIFFNVWKYFRGMTAPVFFTVSGFIFTYLLIKSPEKGFDNLRVKKGIRRGLELLFIGYLLRLNIFGLFSGEIYDTFYLVDVLHCIGLSLMGIVGIYVLTYKKDKLLFPALLVSITVLLFVFEPQYKLWSYNYLPDALANYLTRTNGSIFTIFPWFGYASFGAFISILFTRFKNFKYLYPTAISISMIVGPLLIFYSSDFFLGLTRATGIQIFADIFFNNYLFIRLGDVCIAFAVFMLFRSFMTNTTLLKIGQSTLSIYAIHFIILYGSFTGLGLYYFLDHSLSPIAVILGAIVFMIVCSYSALHYEKHKANIKLQIGTALRHGWTKTESWQIFVAKIVKATYFKVRFVLLKLFGLVKN